MIVFSSNLTCDNNNNFGEREGRLDVKKDQTYTETIMRSIRRDIILGTYRPGDKLVISELKKYYQVSLSVIREALTRLTPDGTRNCHGDSQRRLSGGSDQSPGDSRTQTGPVD